ncbi:maleylpyruvate isomerase N-terminal domain-containing protein [Frankia sp. AgB32]|uniref:maleylpyruvate isomerase N-terminal domain-containing protein n=1 Tax=Frankia sp. AgB32 TaxID=631119 RepID=UPI00200D3223|nr:maleylpyruvate isomerase N-terminal domain-containing protein [Frankia sp. AgB32]MCK9897318.1 maleylpyruvate isomerase N-terminal domain-containing protein [Frankia sp. AgB32]
MSSSHGTRSEQLPPAWGPSVTAPLEAAITETIDVFGALSAEELQAPSACAGWTLHTLLAHLTISVGGVAGLLPLTPQDDSVEFEAAVDAHSREVAARSDAELLDLLRSSLPVVLKTFGEMTDEVAAFPVSLGTAGSYPFGSVSGAIVFDHLCHLRHDVLAPRGPIQRTLPEPDAARLASATGWLIGGIGQMTTDRFAQLLTDPLLLVLTGPGGSTHRVLAHAEGVEPGGDGPVRATVRTSAADFIEWATGRVPRQGRVELSGDAAYADAVLDEFRVY